MFAQVFSWPFELVFFLELCDFKQKKQPKIKWHVYIWFYISSYISKQEIFSTFLFLQIETDLKSTESWFYKT